MAALEAAKKHRWHTSGVAAGEVVVDSAALLSVLQEERHVTAAGSSQLFVLLVASADPATGDSWCPDCVVVRKPLSDVFARLPASAAVVEAPVHRADWKGNAAHPYRKAPFNAGGVPCLLRISMHGGLTVEASLTEGELLSVDLDVFCGLREAGAGFQGLLNVDEALACSPAALSPCSLSERLEGKSLALVYFSANWCGPCRRFTPLLAEWYAKVRGEVEIVFLSCCDDAAAFDTYARKHPWLALPWEVSQGGLGYVRSGVRKETGQAQGRIASLCGVASVPTLGVFDVATGALLCANGRLDISSTDNGPDGAPPVAAYLDAHAVLAKWRALPFLMTPADAPASRVAVVEAALLPALLRDDKALRQAAAASRLFVLLVASVDPATNEMWCPDCVAVREPLTALFARLPKGAAVVQAFVTRAEWKGNAAHPYRQAPFKAGGVPCLLRLGAGPEGGVEASLTEGEILGADLDVFAGLAPDPALELPAGGDSSVLLDGVPANPAHSIAFHIKRQLNLATTPYIDPLPGARGRAMLTCHHGGDLAKVRRVGHFSVFGAPVRVGGASTASKI